jgi:flavodoxin
MKKAILFYYSIHHGNTKKIAEAIARKFSITLLRVPLEEKVDLDEYDLVGFASGIYRSRFGRPMCELIDSLDKLGGKDCFTIYTCGAPGGAFDGEFHKKLKNKGARIAGGFHCRGYDTFGPFKLVGGIAKGHPNKADEARAAVFFSKLM